MKIKMKDIDKLYKLQESATSAFGEMCKHESGSEEQIEAEKRFWEIETEIKRHYIDIGKGKDIKDKFFIEKLYETVGSLGKGIFLGCLSVCGWEIEDYES